MFRLSRTISRLGIPLDGWLPLQNELCLCPGLNLDRNVSPILVHKYVTHEAITELNEPKHVFQVFAYFNGVSRFRLRGKIGKFFKVKPVTKLSNSKSP